MAKLPLYELLINEDEETGVDFIALVDSPAIEYDWVAFKSEFETYSDYPKAASENAKRALELRDKYNLDCGTLVGWTRANQLAKGENISRETIARMSGFERHRENSKGNPKEDCGALMWLAWGGDEGVEWASRKLQQIDFVVEPKAGESENEFVSRCIGIEVDGGMSQEQAAAVCYSKWEKKGFSFKTTDKQIISGPAMIPNQSIYRRGKDGEEYNVVFSKETIQKIVERYFKNQYNSNFNIQHKKNMLAEGVYLIESFIIDSMRGIKAPEGFEDLPDGSWFISCKVDNEEIWNDYIKSGKFKGFSVEGLFTDRKVELVTNVEQAIALVNKLKLNKQNIYTNNMSDVKELLSKLKEIFSEEAMSFEEAKLADGITIIKWEGPLAEGTSVMVVSESGEVPAPDGEHELQDGRKITVENGKVTTLVMPETPAEMPEAPIEIEIEAKQKMAEDYMPMIEEMGAKIMKCEEMIMELQTKMKEMMGATEEKMGSQKEAFSKLVEIVEKLADAPSEKVEVKAFNVNFAQEKQNEYNKLDEILNILNK
jgi:hypothetical protein